MDFYDGPNTHRTRPWLLITFLPSFTCALHQICLPEINLTNVQKIVEYVIQDKLDHPDLYIKTPDTDELGTIDSLKKRIRKGDYESSEVMLRELSDESTTVLCQLVKDFFIDSGAALLMGGDEQFESMLQSVRCCNDPYLMTLIKSLPLAKQSQLG